MIDRILIIDDSQEDQEVYKRYLKKTFGSGLEIVQYINGVKGLEFLSQNQVDCILLDYQLPDMSGIEILQKIVASNTNISPIIMLTGQGSEKVASESFKLGASDYLIKDDLKQETLHKTIVNAVEKLLQAKKIREQEKKIKFMAYHDFLTGVANRVQFEESAKKALARSIRYEKHMSIFIIDLDRFKNVNDTLGHEAGDLLLKEVTRRFQSIIREMDTLARLGGDEFAVIYEMLDNTDSVSVMANKFLNSLRDPILIDDQKIHISASIGIASYPEGGTNISDITRNADVALYKAKGAGKNTFCVFTKKLSMEISKDFYIENFLIETIAKNQLDLHYQPVFNINDNSLYAVEALLRWKSTPSYENITTQDAIIVAENTGLIFPIADFVFETAFNQLKKWEKIKKDIKVTINLSPVQLNRKNFLSQVKEHLQVSQVNPACVIFEITEMAIIKDLAVFADVLTQLRDFGCQIYIDDFGTGYSGLNTILNFPISGLKIDQSYVQNINNPKNAELVKLVFLLAEALKLAVVTEGVETEEQFNIMKNYSAKQKVQGYYLSKAVPADEIEKFLT